MIDNEILKCPNCENGVLLVNEEKPDCVEYLCCDCGTTNTPRTLALTLVHPDNPQLFHPSYHPHYRRRFENKMQPKRRISSVLVWLALTLLIVGFLLL